MIEISSITERALLVFLDMGNPTGFEAQSNEFVQLATSAGIQCVMMISGSRRFPEPRFFIGSGKADEIASAVKEHAIDVVIVNHPLSPSQERNLERHLQCRVLDRSGLILDIFAQRARSHEGKLQVELAQLRHLSTRLVRGWTHLERQKGGIGLRGPGETQLETDRRLLAGRIQHIERRLAKVRRSREQGRQSRRRNEIPVVALVGYTNAGKSTLFNRLTQSSVYAADQLFATLDPTMRRVDLAPHRSLILADTVGFIQDLPHELIAAFQSTLTETREASLLLHVIDAADPEKDFHIEEVERVLKEIGAGEVPLWNVFNKIDLLPDGMSAVGERSGLPSIWISARAGLGVDWLESRLAEHFSETMFCGWVTLPANAGRLRARLFERQAVEAESISEEGTLLVQLNVPKRTLIELFREANIDQDPENLRTLPKISPSPVATGSTEEVDISLRSSSDL